VKNSLSLARYFIKVKNLENGISSSGEKGLVRIHQGHCNIWLELVKNTILKISLVLKVWM
jgi:hypothetical protein